MNDHPIAPRGYLWTTLEEAVLREHYGGPDGPRRCAELLPHRGLAAVYVHAQKLARKWLPSADIDAQITAGYRAASKRGDIKALAARVGRPKWWVCRRAVALGLTHERIKPQAWSRAEKAILEEHASCVIATIRRKLKDAGFSRSDTAIAVQMKRARIDRTDPDSWNAADLGALLGVNGKTVCDWIERRGLVAVNKGTRVPHGTHRVTRKALRAWLATHHGYVDLRKVDQPGFWGVVLE
jgi:hypothetical protein